LVAKEKRDLNNKAVAVAEEISKQAVVPTPLPDTVTEGIINPLREPTTIY
jgi:hypothetical protein